MVPKEKEVHGVEWHKFEYICVFFTFLRPENVTLTSKSCIVEIMEIFHLPDFPPTRSQSSLCCEENYFLYVLIITMFSYLLWSLQKKSNNCQRPASICLLLTHVQWNEQLKLIMYVLNPQQENKEHTKNAAAICFLEWLFYSLLNSWTPQSTRVPSSVQKGKLHVLYWRSVCFSTTMLLQERKWLLDDTQAKKWKPVCSSGESGK